MRKTKMLAGVTQMPNGRFLGHLHLENRSPSTTGQETRLCVMERQTEEEARRDAERLMITAAPWTWPFKTGK